METIYVQAGQRYTIDRDKCTGFSWLRSSNATQCTHYSIHFNSNNQFETNERSHSYVIAHTANYLWQLAFTNCCCCCFYLIAIREYDLPNVIRCRNFLYKSMKRTEIKNEQRNKCGDKIWVIHARYYNEEAEEEREKKVHTSAFKAMQSNAKKSGSKNIQIR